MTGPVVAAVDVGGTTIKGAVVDEAGTALARVDRTVAGVEPGGLVTAVLEHVQLVVERALGLGGAAAVGLAVPGVVDELAGVGRYSMILGWDSVPFVDLLAPLGLPVAFGHDVSSGAYAEARWGAARDRTDWLFLALGTGVGSTFVLGGRPYRGSNGTGGELAHVLVRPGGPLCRCGKHGCVEMVASGPAIAAAYQLVTGSGPVTAEDVARRAEQGDTVAAAVWDDAVAALADAVGFHVESMNPAAVVVGGGVGRAGAFLVDRLETELLPRVRFADPPPVVLPAAFGADAALVGVAARAHELAVSGAGFGVPFLPDAPRPTRTPPRTPPRTPAGERS